MDVQMPIMDGMGATTQIRAREAKTGRPRTPIIALTANAMNHQVRHYMAIGMDGHIAKPIEARALFEVLRGVIESAVGEETAMERSETSPTVAQAKQSQPGAPSPV